MPAEAEVAQASAAAVAAQYVGQLPRRSRQSHKAATDFEVAE
ncbi:MAG TPA: hypothetical protein VGS58_10990 [Candidatus Sulfopaludibacter sp.]|nr:hypothetical protein [Candidatus Sulfopaludibacter sp.]